MATCSLNAVASNRGYHINEEAWEYNIAWG